MNQPQLDPVSVLILFAAAIFSPQVAGIVGPYLVILAGSTLGAYWALGVRDASSRNEGFKYWLAANTAGVLVTVPLSHWLRPYVPDDIQTVWLFGPVAALIGCFWDRLPRVAWRFLRARTAGGAQKDSQ